MESAEGAGGVWKEKEDKSLQRREPRQAEVVSNLFIDARQLG